jgi:hypothetical protein
MSVNPERRGAEVGRVLLSEASLKKSETLNEK